MFRTFLSLISLDNTFLIRFGGENGNFLINISLFDNISWSSTKDENFWVFIYIGISNTDNTLHWYCKTKDSSSLIFYHLFFLNYKFIDLFLNSLIFYNLSVGMTNSLSNMCFCILKYFNFYSNKVVRNLQGIKKILDKDIGFFFYLKSILIVI